MGKRRSRNVGSWYDTTIWMQYQLQVYVDDRGAFLKLRNMRPRPIKLLKGKKKGSGKIRSSADFWVDDGKHDAEIAAICAMTHEGGVVDIHPIVDVLKRYFAGRDLYKATHQRVAKYLNEYTHPDIVEDR